jgi:hypothetical protein
MQRVPVVGSQGNPLMPTKASRARRWIRDGKAVGKWSDTGVFYMQLTQLPSDTKTQKIVIGIDPGKLYSGIGVQSSKVTLFTAHLVLPFETVKKRMEQRRTMRRTRRGRRINRDAPFSERNHRQKRFNNRRGHKISPSIKSNRQLELRVVRELVAIYPVSSIVYEYVNASGSKSFSPVMVGQRFAIEVLESIAPVSTLFGWETANIRRQLGLTKIKDKKSQTPASHAVDGVALAASEFIRYKSVDTGKNWVGSVFITPSLFKIIRRSPVCRRQLHLFQPSKGGKRRAYGGTTTPFNIRKGDLVRYKDNLGYCSGYTGRNISVSDQNWKRLGRYAANKVELVARDTGLLVSGTLNPIRIALVSPPTRSL